ncbi:hypothetical protein [Streptomyces sp. NPDC093149]|uniref:hypothetical protein n=1 Tax=Streptomyces sp. NPDC093149 TaxID=3366031 RepID=UPI00382C2205
MESIFLRDPPDKVCLERVARRPVGRRSYLKEGFLLWRDRRVENVAEAGDVLALFRAVRGLAPQLGAPPPERMGSADLVGTFNAFKDTIAGSAAELDPLGPRETRASIPPSRHNWFHQ